MAAKTGRSRIAQQGWFPDPMDASRQRFWSGQQWLDFVRDERHPARLVKKVCDSDAPPPMVEPVWRVALYKLVIPAICALTAGTLLAAVITTQTGQSDGAEMAPLPAASTAPPAPEPVTGVAP